MRSTTRGSEPKYQLDMLTVRERVATIKRSWTPEEVAQRAAEGRRRRRDLSELIEALEACQPQSGRDTPEFTLIG
jgi:hypothetical protein